MSYNDSTVEFRESKRAYFSNISTTASEDEGRGDVTTCSIYGQLQSRIEGKDITGPPAPLIDQQLGSQSTASASIRPHSCTSNSTATTTTSAPAIVVAKDCKIGNDMAEINFDREMPSIALGRQSRKALSQYLRPPKVGASDWQDMAEEMGFCYQPEILNFALESDPVGSVLSAWNTKAGSTVGRLLDILEGIERYDVLDVLPPLLDRDCKRWREKQQRSQDPVQVPEVSGNFAMPTTPMPELRGITLHDDPAGPPEMFDAYVCFADADIEFVQELVRQLEAPPHNFRLCFDHRNVLPGGSHAIVTAEIIQNRCKKMLVILSPEFLSSESCDFQTKIAVSLEPGARSKRILPILVNSCTPPTIIRHITMCDFTKKDLRPYLWVRLKQAMSMH